MDSCFQLGKIARKKPNTDGKSVPAGSKFSRRSVHSKGTGSVASVFEMFCGTGSALAVLQMGEQPRKSDFSLCTARLGLIQESLEGPGPVLFIKRQLTVHILWERGREILLCKSM